MRRRLRKLNFGFTSVPGQGAAGPVEIIFTVIRRQHLQQVQALVRETQPDAFYSFEEVAGTRETVYPLPIPSARDPSFPLRFFSKRK